MESIRIMSYNIQGKLTRTTDDRTITKVSIVLDYMNNNKYDIVCLQETKAPIGWLKEQVSKSNPTYQVIECTNTDNNNKGGVAIICINPQITLNKVTLDNELHLNWASTIPPEDRTKIEEDSIKGKFMQVSFHFDGREHSIVNVYGPTLMGNTNSHFARSCFYKFLNETIKQHERLIMIGDYNNVTDPEIDVIRTGPHMEDNEDNTEFNNILIKHDLIDTYLSLRDEGSGPMMMTNAHHHTDSTTGIQYQTFKRLDRAYHSMALDGLVLIDMIESKYNNTTPIGLASSHNPIEITINKENTQTAFKKYKGIWRANTSIMNQQHIREKIIRIRNIYWDMCKDKTDKNKLSAYIKMKGEITKLLKEEHYRENTKRKKEKEKIIEQLQLIETITPDERERAMFKLKQHEEYEKTGLIIRTRAQDIESGTNLTAHHFRRAKIMTKQTQTSALLDEEGNLRSTQEEIEEITVKYWSNIMRKRTIDEDKLQSILNNIQKKMSQTSQISLGLDLNKEGFLQFEDLISLDKIKTSIKQMKLAKAPGIDGFSIEMYEILLLDDEKDILVNWLQSIYRYAFDTGKLPDHMRRSQIRLLYKKDNEHDKRYPKNYRPIALLNVDYKILSKLLANELKPHLDQIISEEQYCMPKRYIGDLIHLIQATINKETTSPQNGDNPFLALLDFEKAFDSVNHEFTFKAMEAFGIPKTFIRLTQLAFIDTEACCIVNNKRTAFFPLPGGGRQGDNLYPLIFAIVMEVLNVSIRTQSMEGIRIPNTKDKRLTLAQYADDSTAFGSGKEDYDKLRIAIREFESASGMSVNWDKSTIMFLRDQFLLDPEDPIKILEKGQKTRVLGVMMGHLPDKNTASVKLWEVIRNKLNSKLRSSNNEIKDTITTNSAIIGTAIFPASFQMIMPKYITAIQTHINKFIRGSNYMISEGKRTSSKVDGNIVPEIKLKPMITTVSAKWMAKILTTETWPTWVMYWIDELKAITSYYKFPSIDHLINARSFNMVTVPKFTGQTFQIYTHNSLKAFRDMNYRYHHPNPTWESIANQLIWFNPMIINPMTTKPFSWDDPPFHKIRAKKLKFLYQLLDINIKEYHTKNPVIPTTKWKTALQLNNDLSTATTRLTITQPEWDTLINQIPQVMTDILHEGNQKYFQDEFLATMLKGGEMADVYLLSNGLLTYYTRDPNDDLIINISDQIGYPGQIADDSSQDYPNLTDLKRIKVSAHNNQTHLVSWALPQYPLAPKNRTQKVQFAGLTAASYVNDLGNTYKQVSKQWRLSTNERHHHIAQFALTVFNNSEHDLSPMMKTLKHVPCEPKKVEVMWKLINNGLYIGHRAHRYQVDCKHQNPDGHKTVPKYCIFQQHKFDQGYRPKYPKVTNDTIASYEHILWDSPVAKNVWSLAKKILKDLNIPHVINSWKDIFKTLDGDHKQVIDDIRLIIKHNIVITTIYSLYASYKKLTDLKINDKLIDLEVDMYPIKTIHHFQYQIRNLIYLTPSYAREAKKKARDNQGRLIRDARKQAMAPTLDLGYDPLSDANLQLYRKIWIPAGYVEIKDKKLIVNPMPIEPPHNALIPAPP